MDKQAKKLEQVRALLAKAASTQFPEEADAFRTKADEIMTAYAIDQWMVEEAEMRRHDRPKPERRDMDFAWWARNPFRDQLWWMFSAVARHCRCITVPNKAEYSPYRMPVFGIRSDLDWFDLLFTSLMMQMIQRVDPEPKRDLTVNQNLAVFRDAGVPWEHAINKMINLGEMADLTVEPGTTFEQVYKPWVHAYRRWCRAGNHSQSYVNQQTFRRNFADGFAAEINERLYRMRRESEKHYDADHDSGSMALAVRDIYEQVQESVYIEWPDLRPHPANCLCAKCAARRERNKKPVRVSAAPKERAVDYAAVQAGRAAGANARIEAAPSQRVGSRRDLPTGE